MRFHTVIHVAAAEPLTENRCGVLHDALIHHEHEYMIMDSAIAVDLAAQSIEVEHHVRAMDPPMALRLAMNAVIESCASEGGDWELGEYRVSIEKGVSDNGDALPLVAVLVAS